MSAAPVAGDAGAPEVAQVSASDTRKAGRSRSGCETCRARKVKCDERHGGCATCERLGLQCRPHGSYIDVTSHPSSLQQLCERGDSSNHLTQAGTKRKRTYRSCAECRAAKARCSGEHPSCLRCTNRQIVCKYTAESTPQWARTLESRQGDDIALGEEAADFDTQRVRSQNGDRNKDPSMLLSSFHPPSTGLPSDQQSNSTTFTYEATHQSARVPGTGTFAMLSQTQIGPSNSEHDLSWLTETQLPSRGRCRILVKEYFDNIHPLRSFSFIHRPSFVQRLDEGLLVNGPGHILLHVVCALGAKFHALEYSSTVQSLSARFIRSAGQAWVHKAQADLFSDPGNISIENLMTAVLIHEHELRMGNYAGSFIITGVIARMAQALQVNLEYSTNLLQDEPEGPSISAKESRRRLMWCCYVQDVMIASGVDQLTMFDDSTIKIQLPCTERNFCMMVPCITERLDSPDVLDFVPPRDAIAKSRNNMGLTAYYIRLIRLRKQILRYVKHLNSAKAPWLPDSEFTCLDRAMERWYEDLPANLRFTRSVVYMRKESAQLGAFVLLQCTFYQSLCDLYRIGLPKLYRLDVDFIGGNLFETQVRDRLFEQAKNVSRTLAEASQHGLKALSDTWMSSIAFDSNKTMLYYITRIIDPQSPSGRSCITETLPFIQSNIAVLQRMQAVCVMAETLYNAALLMGQKSGLFVNNEDTVHGNPAQVSTASTTVSDMTAPEEGVRPVTPAQSAPDYELQPTAIYRLARSSVPERHAAGNASSPSASTQSPGSVRQNLPIKNGIEGLIPGQDNTSPQFPGTSQQVSQEPSNTPPQHLAYQAGLAKDTTFGPTISTAALTDQSETPSLASFRPQDSSINSSFIGNTTINVGGLAPFFSPGFACGWQPSETVAISAMDSSGLPPWCDFGIWDTPDSSAEFFQR